MTSRTSELAVTLGCMTWGAPGTDARITDLSTCKAVLDEFMTHGHNEVDNAYAYASGTCEEYLGKMDWQSKGVVVDTKLVPSVEGGHTRDSLRKHIKIQLKSLNAEKVDMWYLHAPDRNTPYEETLAAVDELHKEGLFNRFGISNFAAWEVAYIVGICEKNNYIKPSAYQGLYNALHRKVEPELFPCLRKLGISFYEFNGLGGGMLTGRYKSLNDEAEDKSRFDVNTMHGKAAKKRYWNAEYFKALEVLGPVAEKHGLTLAEIALRWLSHHSQMKKEYGDNIIIGASSVQHVKENCEDLEKGLLPDEVVKALDEAWEIVKPVSTPYHW